MLDAFVGWCPPALLGVLRLPQLDYFVGGLLLLVEQLLTNTVLLVESNASPEIAEEGQVGVRRPQLSDFTLYLNCL